MPINLYCNRGVALFTVIVFIIIIASLATVAVFIMTGTAHLSRHQVERIQAKYAAEAGLVQGLEMLRNGQTFATTTVIVGDGENKYDVVLTTSSINVGSAYQYDVTQLDATVQYPQ